MEGGIDGDWLAGRVVVITQLAEECDRGTLQVALRLVPVQWWEARLGRTVPPELRSVSVRRARVLPLVSGS